MPEEAQWYVFFHPSSMLDSVWVTIIGFNFIPCKKHESTATGGRNRRDW
jgi:hypothetical protein